MGRINWLIVNLGDVLIMSPMCRYYLLPALFSLFSWLEEQHHEGNLRYSLQFRSFGSDLPKIVTEFNALVNGRHPLHPYQALHHRHMINLDDPEGFGSFYRDETGDLMGLNTCADLCLPVIGGRHLGTTS